MNHLDCFGIVVKSVTFFLLWYYVEDERMYHLCMWPGHREHFHERDDVFYKRFSEILAFDRLVSFILRDIFFN